MANGLDLKERVPASDIPENDPLLELSRIIGFDQPRSLSERSDPQMAVEDRFSMDLERELSFDEAPATSSDFDAEFAAAFEEDLSGALRFEPDAPSVEPSLEDELSALLMESSASVAPALPDTDSDLILESGVEPVQALDAAFGAGAELRAPEVPAWMEEEAQLAEPEMDWPEIVADDALEADPDNRFEGGALFVSPSQDAYPENPDELLAGPRLDMDDSANASGSDTISIDPEFADEFVLDDQQPAKISQFESFDPDEPLSHVAIEPVNGDSDYQAQDGFDAFAELAALDVPPAPEFAEWKPVDLANGGNSVGSGRSAGAGAVFEPLVGASEPKADEVLQTDEFDIPDFEFHSLNDTPSHADMLDDYSDEIVVPAAKPVTAAVDPMAFDESKFNFDALIDEELAAGAATAAATSGAAAAMRSRAPSLQVNADSEFDPFQRVAMADDVFAPMPEPTRRKPWIVPVAILGVLALLGGSWFALSGGNSTSTSEGPVLVKADAEPVKIAPENPGGATVANQDKAVYDKVQGDQASLPAQGTLVSESEEPVDIAAVTPSQTPQSTDAAEASAEPTAKAEDRVEAPSSEEPQAPAAETSAVAPKKVRTVIVKPDGTLVERPVEAAVSTEQAADALAGESNAVASIAPAQDAAPSTAETTPVPEAKPIVAADPAAETAPAGEDPIAQIAAVEPEPAKSPEPVAAPAEPAAVEAQPEPAAAAPAIKVVKTKKIKAPAAEEVAAPAVEAVPVAERPADQPVNIVGQTGGQQSGGETQVAAADAAPAPVAGAYSIQIASTPSPEAAKSTYAALSRKFGGVIGGRGVNIQKADVEGKGTVYRVRIPAGSKQDAAALCAQYKSAGGNCFVTR